jgi:glycosyltransferase involved in cell wall biosynthesis
MREMYQDQCGYPAGRMVVLPNAVDTELFQPVPRDPALSARLGLSEDTFVVMSVGGLYPNKGHRFLLGAIAQVRRSIPGVRLVVVGEGRERRKLERQVMAEGIEDCVHFAGLQHNVPQWLSLADIFVQPSLIEADPLALHEAMAMGLPVVATDSGGVPELLEYGSAGVLVPPADPRGLARALERLAANPSEVAVLGQSARRSAVEKFNLTDYEERLWEVYRGLLEN